MATSIESMVAETMSRFYGSIEAAYYQKVAELEGRVPSASDIVEHGHRLIDPEGKTTLTWKGLPIVEWDAMPMQWSEDGTKAIITFRK